jgi:hypothetical protein
MPAKRKRPLDAGNIEEAASLVGTETNGSVINLSARDPQILDVDQFARRTDALGCVTSY